MALTDKQLWDQATRKPVGQVIHYSGYSLEMIEPTEPATKPEPKPEPDQKANP